MTAIPAAFAVNRELAFLTDHGVQAKQVPAGSWTLTVHPAAGRWMASLRPYPDDGVARPQFVLVAAAEPGPVRAAARQWQISANTLALHHDRIRTGTRSPAATAFPPLAPTPHRAPQAPAAASQHPLGRTR
ncbi:hypothetical protein ACWT_5805 [Actinoplanes sp. SE50]|uniref:hypothetical protein n=1 Tax=unclassified Actinoplanes TaxID=2626549 RepID=UPI00023EBC08|nr:MULTISPECIES: hypothetical protein [unclassified Actinoplanes]AEV86823.1 hypothetical protein ACPL_5936 [Actinoplanes sp. SE50/110]ATO85220.1 hypothetical protein ACWT_5805 [Actinoplanes sp. SE50]SLM02630.1 hypothetical protein ACSP50_5912 [Actinoplanes sp. SE50/110]